MENYQLKVVLLNLDMAKNHVSFSLIDYGLMIKRMNERANEQTNKGMNEGMNERMNEQIDG